MVTSHACRFGRHALVLSIAVVVGVAGCTIIPTGIAANVAGEPDMSVTRASLRLTEADLSSGVFVGVAMSGGGMRAANFSAATLLELESLGLLRHASAMSSVSGSSLTAAYFGLFGPIDGVPETADAARWSSEAVKERFRIDLQTHWILWWLNPWNVVRYWLTGFDRSDIMKTVFDFYVFGSPDRRHPRFADLRQGRPKILINATSLTGVRRFVFSDEGFAQFGSRLDRYPVSHAVMASGAFPGAFHNVTLTSWREPGEYEHLFDGGPSDNLGVEALVDLLDRGPATPRSCFLFLIDAYPYARNRGLHDFDTRRRFTDFIVDRNLADSASVFLTLSRLHALHRIGLPEGTFPGSLAQWTWRRPDRRYDCRVWHLTFETLFARPITTEAEGLREELRELRQASAVATRYRLEGIPKLSESEIQERLFQAATYLVRRDGSALDEACRWFTDAGLGGCRR
jgi:predicted acylesterase/phospholipase RssA